MLKFVYLYFAIASRLAFSIIYEPAGRVHVAMNEKERKNSSHFVNKLRNNKVSSLHKYMN